MDFHVPKADERAAIIQYLKLLSSPQTVSNSPARYPQNLCISTAGLSFGI
jgi:hypothetical protein